MTRRLILIAVLAALSGCRLDHGLEPKPASWSGIEGTVLFSGEWMEGLEEVRVAVYRDYPPADSSDFFRIAGFSDPLPLGSARASYRVPLADGVYRWVVAAGRRVDQGWVEGYVFLGQHTAEPGDESPAPVTVYPNRSTTAIDVLVDFSELPDLPLVLILGPGCPGDSSPRTGRFGP